MQANPNTQKYNREYLVMADLQSHLYYNNHWIKLNVHFDISIDGYIDEDESNEGVPNLKNGWLLF